MDYEKVFDDATDMQDVVNLIRSAEHPEKVAVQYAFWCAKYEHGAYTWNDVLDGLRWAHQYGKTAPFSIDGAERIAERLYNKLSYANLGD